MKTPETGCIICEAFSEFGDDIFEHENNQWFYRAVTLDDEDGADFKNFPRKGPYKDKPELVSAFLVYLSDLASRQNCQH